MHSIHISEACVFKGITTADANMLSDFTICQPEKRQKVTLLAFVRFFHVLFQMDCLNSGKFALIAFVGHFPRVSFQLSPWLCL